MGRGKARVMLAVVELICAREAAWVWARVCRVGFSSASCGGQPRHGRGRTAKWRWKVLAVVLGVGL